MEFEVDVEQFLFSGNLNALEFWKRRTKDFLNVLNTLCRRLEEIQNDGVLTGNINQLIFEIQHLRGMFERTI